MSVPESIQTAATRCVAAIIAEYDMAKVTAEPSQFISHVGGIKTMLEEKYWPSNAAYIELYIHFMLPLRKHYQEFSRLGFMAHDMRDKVVKLCKGQLKEKNCFTLERMKVIAGQVLTYLLHDVMVEEMLHGIYKAMMRAEEDIDAYLSVLIDFMCKLDAAKDAGLDYDILVVLAKLKKGESQNYIDVPAADVPRLQELYKKYFGQHILTLDRLSVEECKATCDKLLVALATNDAEHVKADACAWLGDNCDTARQESHADVALLYQVLLGMGAHSGVLALAYPWLGMRLAAPVVVRAWHIVRTSKLNTIFLVYLLREVLNNLDTCKTQEFEECVTDIVLELGRGMIMTVNPEFLPKVKAWASQLGKTSAANMSSMLGMLG